mgnify:CR=1 FL=1
MKVIQTFKDIGKLKQQGTQKFLREYVQQLFFHLHKALEPRMPAHLFDLKDYGYIAVLEAGDDIRNLSEIGLSAENDGLLGTVPEAVTAKILIDRRVLYQAEILYNNEYMMYVLLFPEDFDKQVQEWVDTYKDEEVG